MGMREKLIELVSDAELPMKNDGKTIGWFALGFHEALYMADHLIANDVVPVVRCKDCKHYKPQSKSAHWNSTTPYCCRCTTVKVSPDDFCSYGERKDNG